MHDPRIDKLAQTLIEHSCQLAAGEKILIEAFDLPEPALVVALVELAADMAVSIGVREKMGRMPVATFSFSVAMAMDVRRVKASRPAPSVIHSDS